MKPLLTGLFLIISTCGIAQSPSSFLFMNEYSSAIQQHGSPGYSPWFKKAKPFIKDQKGATFGVRLGITGSNMNFNKGYPPLAVPAEASWKLGGIAGFSWQIPLYPYRIFLKQEYLLSLMRGEDKRMATKYVFIYVSLPVLFKYVLSERFSLIGGPQFDILIQARESVNGRSSDITHDIEERSFAVACGMEFLYSERLSLSARFMHGLNHIGIEERSVEKEFKYEIIQVAAEFSIK